MRLHLSRLRSARRQVRFAAAAIACIASALSSSAVASPPLLTPFIDDPHAMAAVQYPDLPGWSFFRTSSYCYVSTENEFGRLLIGYNGERNEVHLGFWSDTAASYLHNSNVTIEVLMVDRKPDGELGENTRYWAPQSALVLVNDAGKAVFNVKFDGRQALITLSRHAAISFVHEREMLEAFSLRGSGVALRRLQTCSPR